MANTLTNLIPIAYRALDIVSRELTGLISAVNVDAAADTIAQGQTIYSPVVPSGNAIGNITPAMTVTAANDITYGTKSLVVDNFKVSGFNWTGEEEFGINSGVRMENLMRDQLAQEFRKHINAMELALCTAAKNGASRAIGTTAGTAPILADIAGAKKILDDNGAPMSDRSVILDTTAGVAFRGISNLFKVNEAGESGLLRNGVLGSLYGFDVRESAGIQPVTKGGMTGALINNGNIAVGSTVLTYDGGTVNTTGFAAGDIITIGTDANKYVVEVGSTSTTGTITIAAPGLRVATANDTAITVFGTSTRNIALSRNAITLATRLPKFQANDMAADRMVITDPNTGISFEMCMWPGQRMVKYEVAIAYGMTVIKPEHLAVIIG
jgi:hypothetical protein